MGIKELILKVDEIIGKECVSIGLCEKCGYNKRINSKCICVIVEELADKYNKS
jgi:hypothetical protein